MKKIAILGLVLGMLVGCNKQQNETQQTSSDEILRQAYQGTRPSGVPTYQQILDERKKEKK